MKLGNWKTATWQTVTMIGVLVTTSALANKEELTGLKCGGFSASFAGPRYMESIVISDEEGDIVKQLLSDKEKSLKLYSNSISLNVTIGACEKGNDEKTLLHCSLGGRDHYHAFGELAFTHGKSVNKHFYESIRTERTLRAKTLDMKVVTEEVWDQYLKRNVTMAKLILDANVETALRTQDLHIEKILGEWVGADGWAWNGCSYVSRNY
jgi:hypothetical protein